MGCFPGRKLQPGDQGGVAEPAASKKVKSSTNTGGKREQTGGKQDFSERIFKIEGDDFVRLGGSFVLKVYAKTPNGKHLVGEKEVGKNDDFNMLQAEFKLEKLLKVDEKEVEFLLHFVYESGNTFRFRIKTKSGVRTVKKEFGIAFEVVY